MRRATAVAALGAALVCAGCGDSKPMVTGVTNAAPAPVPTPVKPALPVETDPGLIVSGPIIVEHQVDVTAQRDGLLLKVLVDAPARVKAGAVLAQMDDRQITANLEAARAKSRSIADDLNNWKAEAGVLEADYVRAQHLWDLGLISQEQLQHAQYKVESDQWDIKRVQETLNTAHEEERSLELELAKTKIVAPFSGVIARRYVREGQEVNKGERLFWVTAEAPLLMRFTLPEKYFGRVRTGHVFEVTSPDVPNEQHGARVKEISPVIDPSSGTFEVLVELTGKPGSLRPGMTANLKVENNSH
ncbi:MAG: efflux RND transporter periplasmic adaptor subunit [Candidatus Acidiferrum sp.]